MNPKKTYKMHKLFCLSSLLLENLDELQVTSPTVLKYKSDLTAFCEEPGCRHPNESCFFHKQKIDTILRKEFNEYVK
jgi:hypothetical protein